MRSYEEVISEYEDIDIRIKELEETKTTLRNEIADLMHLHKVDNIIIKSIKEVQWKCAYLETTRKSCDYELLFNIVGPSRYSEIVKTNTSNSLTIKKAPKEKSTNKTKIAPVTNKMGSPPIGNLM